MLHRNVAQVSGVQVRVGPAFPVQPQPVLPEDEELPEEIPDEFESAQVRHGTGMDQDLKRNEYVSITESLSPGDACFEPSGLFE